MKILALESSAVACSAALCEDENLIAQSFQDNGLTHSVTLLPMAAALLEQCGASLEQVDVVAVAAGPGSFTGLLRSEPSYRRLPPGLQQRPVSRSSCNNPSEARSGRGTLPDAL